MVDPMKPPKKKTQVPEKARDRKSRAFSFVGNNRSFIRARFGAAVRARWEELRGLEIIFYQIMGRIYRTEKLEAGSYPVDKGWFENVKVWNDSR